MIDLFSITINMLHNKFGSERTKKTEKGEVTNTRFSKTIYINHIPFFVTSLCNGARINIRCCPLKVLQGHNVFGTNSLKKLWRKFICDVLEQLEIFPTEDQLLALRKGEFQVDEIHLTHRFPVECYSMVQNVITHILRNSSMSLSPSLIAKGTGVTLQAPHGLASWLIYDKHSDFVDKRTKEQKYLETVAGGHAEKAKRLLLKLSRKSIRTELKLGKKYLKVNGLDRGKNWTEKMAVEVFLRELGLLHLGDFPSLPQMPNVYKKIADVKLRDVLMLWGSGKDMSTHGGKTTREAHRREIKKLIGIDILKDCPVIEPASINLSDIFNPSNMLTGFPKWANKYPEIAVR